MSCLGRMNENRNRRMAMRKWIVKLFVLVFSIMMIGAVGCQKAEDTGDTVEDAVEEAADNTGEAMEEAGDMAEDTAEEVEEEM